MTDQITSAGISAAAGATSAGTSAAGTGAANALTSDFNTFLTLLTTQVTNQDPLSPMDSTQFVEQLATFSGLEQQVTANSHLEQIASLLQANFGTSAQTLIGANITASSLTIDGAFSEMTIGTDEATTGTLIISNAAGQEVFRSARTDEWSWDGRLANGNAAPAGTYTFEVQNDAGERMPARAFGSVESLTETADGTTIGLQPGVTSSNFVKL